jgi:SAM-dependent methyltransferase
MRNRISKEQSVELATSPSVKTFGREIVIGAGGAPILDVPCGTGRNGAWISYIGGQVIGLDIDLRRIKNVRREGIPPFGRAFRRIKLHEMDLINEPSTDTHLRCMQSRTALTCSFAMSSLLQCGYVPLTSRPVTAAEGEQRTEGCGYKCDSGL